MSRWQRELPVCFLLMSCIGCGRFNDSETPSSGPPSNWTFKDANDLLFAIESGGSYGTERGVLSSSDLGQTWQSFDAPQGTCDLAGNGASLFAITSAGQIFRKSAGQTQWTLFGRGGPTEYLYAALAARDGRLLVTSAHEVTPYSPNGVVEHCFTITGDRSTRSDRTFFVGCRFVSDDERFVALEANPFQVFVIDLTEHTIQPWSEGLDQTVLEGEFGPCRVRRHGDGFLLSHRDGIYVADGLLQPWQPLIESDRALLSYCRDLISHGDAGEWLLADGRGIQLMNADQTIKTVFQDSPDAHDLVLGLTEHRDHYSLSFARLKDGCIGVQLTGDLSHWNALTLIAASADQ